MVQRTGKGDEAMQEQYRLLREAAYARGLAEYDDLAQLPTFRDFVALYIAKGYKRSRNVVRIANSDERIVKLAVSWLGVLTSKPLRYAVQYHVDPDLDEISRFWGEALEIDGSTISLQRKSNSGQLRFRTWRCVIGVLSVSVGDTLLRARLQGWVDRIGEDWRLDSASPRGA